MCADVRSGAVCRWHPEPPALGERRIWAAVRSLALLRSDSIARLAAHPLAPPTAPLPGHAPTWRRPFLDLSPESSIFIQVEEVGYLPFGINQ
jgi:hypothetical protein